MNLNPRTKEIETFHLRRYRLLEQGQLCTLRLDPLLKIPKFLFERPHFSFIASDKLDLPDLSWLDNSNRCSVGLLSLLQLLHRWELPALVAKHYVRTLAPFVGCWRDFVTAFD